MNKTEVLEKLEDFFMFEEIPKSEIKKLLSNKNLVSIISDLIESIDNISNEYNEEYERRVKLEKDAEDLRVMVQIKESSIELLQKEIKSKDESNLILEQDCQNYRRQIIELESLTEKLCGFITRKQNG